MPRRVPRCPSPASNSIPSLRRRESDHRLILRSGLQAAGILAAVGRRGPRLAWSARGSLAGGWTTRPGSLDGSNHGALGGRCAGGRGRTLHRPWGRMGLYVGHSSRRRLRRCLGDLPAEPAEGLIQSFAHGGSRLRCRRGRSRTHHRGFRRSLGKGSGAEESKTPRYGYHH